MPKKGIHRKDFLTGKELIDSTVAGALRAGNDIPGYVCGLLYEGLFSMLDKLLPPKYRYESTCRCCGKGVDFVHRAILFKCACRNDSSGQLFYPWVWVHADASVCWPVGDMGAYTKDAATGLSSDNNILILERQRIVRDVLQTLTPREEKIVRMFFGLGEKREHTLEEIADDFDVTRERVRQIRNKALRKLRHPSRNRLWQGLKGD